MLRFIGSLLRPYRRTLAVIFLAMLVETVMSLATPWPLKIILDNVVGTHKLSPWLHRFIGPMLESGSRLHVAMLAALAFVLIAVVGAIASYIDNYYTESVGQWVAHDLRMRMYNHLQRLSLGFYNTHQTGTILSTLTTDIQTIQGFASSSTLSILVDMLTIVCMLGLIFEQLQILFSRRLILEYFQGLAGAFVALGSRRVFVHGSPLSLMTRPRLPGSWEISR